MNPIVIVKKPNGSVPVCLDPRDLNKAIQREHFPLKTVEEVAGGFNGANVFSTLDAASVFYQIKLAEESSWLTNFTIPFRRCKFERLPIGITSVPQIFQRNVCQIFENREGCDIIVDDIFIWVKDMDEYNRRQEAFLEKCETADLRLNRGKCKLGKKEVKYVGHTL